MARTGKENAKKPKGTKTSGGSKGRVTDQMKALGGEEQDLELLKGVDGDAGLVTGDKTAEPGLMNEVDSFLKKLAGPSASSSSASKAKSKAKKNIDAPTAVVVEKKETKKTKKKDSEKKNAPAPPQASSSNTDSRGNKTKGDKKKSAKGPTPPSTTQDSPEPESKPKLVLPSSIPLNSKPSKFIVAPSSQWYTLLPPLPAPPTSTSTPPTPPSASQISQLSSKAADLHAADIQTYTSSSSSSSSSEASFLSNIIQSGTLSDRLSALTLLVQSTPVHNVKALGVLKGMAERGKGQGGREESLKALRCVVDWWVGGGAPGRKLRYFRDQPLTHPDVTEAHLVLWYFEDWLKKYFFSILQILETLSLDPLSYVRTQTLTLLATLLREKPEQEHNLLRLLVNKLGDTEKPICAKASHHLLQILQTHPSMKCVVVREITSLVLRPPSPPPANSNSNSAPTSHPNKSKVIRFDDAGNPSPTTTGTKPSHPKTKAEGKKIPLSTQDAHIRYYATITFNQIVLTPQERDVALRLVDVYFEMFREVLGGLGPESEAKLVDEAQIDEEGEVQVDKKGRVRSASVNGNGKKGGGGKSGKSGRGDKGAKERKGAAGFMELEDSSSKLVSAILTGVNRALPFARVESGDEKLNKHIDTLFLITHKSTFNISLQALVLIQQISASVSSASTSTSTPTSTSTSPPSNASPSNASTSTSTSKSITDRYYRTLYSSLFDPRLATSSKQAMYLNLLFKSVKADSNSERVRAVVRRFVQVLVSGGGGGAGGGGGGNEFVAGGLWLVGELFSTVPGLRQSLNASPSPSNEKTKENAYDPLKRDPQFAHASTSPLWELTPLLHHYHPTISLYARQLLTAQPLTGSADLTQNTLSHFLDRFVYKNPKKLKSRNEEDDLDTTQVVGKGGSAMQPAASGYEGGGVKIVKGQVGRSGSGIGGRGGGGDVMMNEEAFVRRKEGDVPVDQVFFHRFFTRKNKRSKGKTVTGDEDDEDDEDEEESEGDEDEDDASATAAPGEAEDEDDSDDTDDEEEAEIWKAMKATMPKVAGEDDDLMIDSDIDGDDSDSDSLPFDEADFSDSDEESEVEAEDEDQDEVSLEAAADEDDEDDGNGDGNGEADEEDEDDDGMSLAENSDDDDLMPLDPDGLSGLLDFPGGSDDDDDAPPTNDDEDTEWGGISSGGAGASGQKKRKRGAAGAGDGEGESEAENVDGKESKRQTRKKAKRSLPTFASYEDYAKLIEEGPEDDI